MNISLIYYESNLLAREYINGVIINSRSDFLQTSSKFVTQIKRVK